MHVHICVCIHIKDVCVYILLPFLNNAIKCMKVKLQLLENMLLNMPQAIALH